MIWNRLFGSLNERELDEELEFHRTMKERGFLAQGMTTQEARDAARRAMGNVTLASEDSRAEWTFAWLSDFTRDVHYGLRTLAAQPAFTFAAVMALVLGIGVNAIVFNIYNALALTPWAVRDAASVVRVMRSENSRTWDGFSWPAYHYLRDHGHSLAGITAFETTDARIVNGDSARLSNGIAADENFFDVLGTGFAAGRGFSPSNGNPLDPAPEVVLHYREWMRHYNGDPNAIGKWIEMNGRRFQIVGVAAEGLSGPVPVSPDFWVPAPWRDKFHPGIPSMDKPDACCTRVIARLKDSSQRDPSMAELTTLITQFNTLSKGESSRVVFTALTMLADPRTRRQSAPLFLAVATASLLVLLLACANVANLQLARGMSRWREFAVRTSLGASRGRILRQLLVESMLLSVAAGLLTALLSSWAPTAIMRYVADSTNESGSLNFSFHNDWRVIGVVIVLSLLATLLFGLIPASTVAGAPGSVSESCSYAAPRLNRG